MIFSLVALFTNTTLAMDSGMSYFAHPIVDPKLSVSMNNNRLSLNGQKGVLRIEKVEGTKDDRIGTLFFNNTPICAKGKDYSYLGPCDGSEKPKAGEFRIKKKEDGYRIKFLRGKRVLIPDKQLCLTKKGNELKMNNCNKDLKEQRFSFEPAGPGAFNGMGGGNCAQICNGGGNCAQNGPGMGFGNKGIGMGNCAQNGPGMSTGPSANPRNSQPQVTGGNPNCDCTPKLPDIYTYKNPPPQEMNNCQMRAEQICSMLPDEEPENTPSVQGNKPNGGNGYCNCAPNLPEIYQKKYLPQNKRMCIATEVKKCIENSKMNGAGNIN